MSAENYITTPVPPHIRHEIYSLGEGPSIVQRLLHDPLRAAMHSAAEAGLPPATAVSGPLLDQLGPHISSHRYKRFVGACVSWILKSDGYEIKGQPARVPGDRLFKTATRFVRRPPSVSPSGADGDRFDLLRRIATALKPDELAFLADLVSRSATTQVEQATGLASPSGIDAAGPQQAAPGDAAVAVDDSAWTDDPLIADSTPAPKPKRDMSRFILSPDLIQVHNASPPK